MELFIQDLQSDFLVNPGATPNAVAFARVMAIFSILVFHQLHGEIS